MLDGETFHQPVKNNIKMCKNTRTITSGQRDDYAADYLLVLLISKKITN